MVETIRNGLRNGLSLSNQHYYDPDLTNPSKDEFKDKVVLIIGELIWGCVVGLSLVTWFRREGIWIAHLEM